MKNLKLETAGELEVIIGCYFETTKELATVFANGFYFTNKRKDATDREHCLHVTKTISYTGSYLEDGFHKEFYCDDAVVVNQ